MDGQVIFQRLTERKDMELKWPDLGKDYDLFTLSFEGGSIARKALSVLAVSLTLAFGVSFAAV